MNIYYNLAYGISVGIALSIDAFMVSLLYGTSLKSRKQSLLTSSIVGSFHFFMPFIGYFLAVKLLQSVHLAFNTEIIAALILFMLGLMMIRQKEEESDSEQPNLGKIIGKLMFAFSVSIDSLLVGLSFKLGTEVNILFCAFLFAMVSGVITFIGLSIGKKTAERLLHLNLDQYAGAILIILSIFTFLSNLISL
ncbi:manganese efflux pump MntP [Haloplasma contractile]|uniref:Manganese efflux pump MntP protein n=1 Tax=Haloplasma contractile SSD-17B TaxID=1033810 RepID=U2FMS2_9MOLU|nr:manganese efflux pump [Haloplasma contractile]ERJ12444.1 Putative manganese efflux pump MntP protein [Haloplasma contractile SSD-17B]